MISLFQMISKSTFSMIYAIVMSILIWQEVFIFHQVATVREMIAHLKLVMCQFEKPPDFWYTGHKFCLRVIHIWRHDFFTYTWLPSSRYLERWLALWWNKIFDVDVIYERTLILFNNRLQRAIVASDEEKSKLEKNFLSKKILIYISTSITVGEWRLIRTSSRTGSSKSGLKVIQLIPDYCQMRARMTRCVTCIMRKTRQRTVREVIPDVSPIYTSCYLVKIVMKIWQTFTTSSGKSWVP